MKFKEFLDEQTLKSSIFNKTIQRLGNDALLGYELEMWVPSTSPLFIGEITVGGGETKAVNDDWTLDEFRAYFTIDHNTYIDILDDYVVYHKEHGGKWPDFIKHLGGAYEFLGDYEGMPRYGWADSEQKEVFKTDPEQDEGEADFDGTCGEIAREMGEFLGVKIYVGYSGTNDKWRIVEDGSINGKGLGVGVEVVSPPLPVAHALIDLEECFYFMRNNDLMTNESTGLHLNLSIPGLKTKLDPLKLILFMGEDHVLKSYKRESNGFTSKHTDDILDHVRDHGTLPKDADELISFARSALKKEKYRSVNLAKLLAGYLEFRVAGNTDYHKKYKQVKDDIGRYLTVIELACDPNASRNEYLKKLTKLMGRGSQNFLNFNLDEVIETMKRQERKTRVDFDDPTDQLIHIIHFFGRRVFDKKIELPEDFKKEFKELFMKIKDSEPDAMDRIKKKIGNDPDLITMMRTFRIA